MTRHCFKSRDSRIVGLTRDETVCAHYNIHKYPVFLCSPMGIFPRATPLKALHTCKHQRIRMSNHEGAHFLTRSDQVRSEIFSGSAKVEDFSGAARETFYQIEKYRATVIYNGIYYMFTELCRDI